eukprot:2129505-Pyramimonas_sp.AAC.1
MYLASICWVTAAPSVRRTRSRSTRCVSLTSSSLAAKSAPIASRIRCMDFMCVACGVRSERRDDNGTPVHPSERRDDNVTPVHPSERRGVMITSHLYIPQSGVMIMSHLYIPQSGVA